MKSVMIAALLAPALALAQPKTADDWYKEGENQYNLGNFDAAADAFKQGFAAETDDSKKPAYIYNVAQAYRQANKCRDSAFFYKRYLSLKEQDTVKPLKPEKRTEIELRITELEECAKNQGGGTTTTPKIGPKTGTGTTPKTGTGTGTTVKTGTGTTGTGTGTGTTGTGTGTGTTTAKTGGTGTTGTGTTGTGATTTVGQVGTEEGQEEEGGEEEGGEDVGGVSAWSETGPKLFSARFQMGVSKISAGDLDMGARATIALTGGYPVYRKDKLLVEAGGMFTYTPVNYENMITTATHRAAFVGLLANGAATYNVMPKISVRGDLGVGLLEFGGISEMGNPFTENGASTSGPLGMFAMRLAASADYEITPNIIATATPFAFSVSPAKSGLREDIGTIMRFDFMVGVGYRM